MGGGLGLGLARALAAEGWSCQVVAPSKTPRRAGDRIKADRRDAVALARLLRSGDLVPVTLPDEGVEASRDLVRVRPDAKRAETAARHHLDKLLLRQDRIDPGKCHWTEPHHGWLRQQRSEHAALQALRGVQLVTAATQARDGSQDQRTSPRMSD